MGCCGCQDDDPCGFAGRVKTLINGQIKVLFAFADIDNAMKDKFCRAKPNVIGQQGDNQCMGAGMASQPVGPVNADNARARTFANGEFIGLERVISEAMTKK
jgi:hypothetical protein